MRISDWSSDVCSSDLSRRLEPAFLLQGVHVLERAELRGGVRLSERELDAARRYRRRICLPCPQSYAGLERRSGDAGPRGPGKPDRGEYLRFLARLSPPRPAHPAQHPRPHAPPPAPPTPPP